MPKVDFSGRFGVSKANIVAESPANLLSLGAISSDEDILVSSPRRPRADLPRLAGVTVYSIFPSVGTTEKFENIEFARANIQKVILVTS